MRIKIIGEITEARLAEALQKALEQYRAVKPGAQIFGANLYLQAFDEHGEAFEVGTRFGNPLMITLKPEKGTVVKPAISAEAHLRREAEKEEQERLEQQREEQRKIAQAEQVAWLKSIKEKDDELRKIVQIEDDVTAFLLKYIPDRFCTEMNHCIDASWQELKPTRPNGKRKGEPVTKPRVAISEGSLKLFSEDRKHPLIITNPIWSRRTSGFGENMKLEPYWANEAWRLAAQKMKARMAELVDEVNSPLKAQETDTREED